MGDVYSGTVVKTKPNFWQEILVVVFEPRTFLDGSAPTSPAQLC